MKKVTSLLFEIVRVLVRFDHVASFIVNADHSTMCDCTMIAGRNRSFLLIRKFVISCRRRIAMATIHHELSINAPVAKVYEALSLADQIGTWWDKQPSRQIVA